MLYVIQTIAGNEHRVLERCKKNIILPEEEAFIPTYEKKKRERGEDIIMTKVLFPGYVFYRSDQPEELYDRLKSVPYLTKLIGSDAGFIPVSQHEEELLTGLGGENHNIEVSIGVIEKGKLIVLSGPLEKFTGKLLYYNRRKKIAGIEFDFLGETRSIQVGLEIIGKR